jgi:hypothetical protein
MSKPINKTIYKQFPQSETQDRSMTPLSFKHKSQGHVIVSNFIKYMIKANS